MSRESVAAFPIHSYRLARGTALILALYLASFPSAFPSQSAATGDLGKEAQQSFQKGEQQRKLQTGEGYQAAVPAFQKAAQIYHRLGMAREEALSLYRVGDLYQMIGLPEKALESFRLALPLQQKVGDRVGAARTLNYMGEIYTVTGQPQKALELYNQALPLSRQTGDQAGEATTLNNMGVVWASLGQPQKALDYYQKALLLRRQVGPAAGVANTLNSIAGIYYHDGELNKALEYYQQALPLWQQAGYREGEAATLNNLGLLYQQAGEPLRSLESFEHALLLQQDLGDKQGEATTLTNIAGICRERGEPQKAIESCQKALPLRRAVEDKVGEAATLNLIGLICKDIGDFPEALNYEKQALELSRRASDVRDQAAALHNTGAIYDDTGEWEKALDYYGQAMPLLRQSGDKAGEAILLSNLGTIYENRNQPQKALEFLQRALLLQRQVGSKAGEASALNGIGQAYEQLAQLQMALQFYNQALPLWRQVGDKRGQATTLVNSAHVLSTLQRREEALVQYEEALVQAESILGTISIDELKRSAAEPLQFIYQSYIDFLLGGAVKDNQANQVAAPVQASQADLERAMQVSEMARSRAFRDLLAGSDSELPGAVVQHSIRSAPSIIRSLKPDSPHSIPSRTPRASPPAKTPRASSLSLFRGLRPAVRSAVGRAVEDLPPLTSTFNPEPFHREDAVLAASDGPVISYQLLGRDLAIFLVEPSGKMHAARSPVDPGTLLTLIRSARLNINANDDPEGTRTALRQLYDLLIKPVENWISAPEHPYTHTPILTVVPYGPLFQAPFAALLGQDGHYLVERYALRTAPSLTVLRFTRQRSVLLREAPMRALLYGDPMMPGDMPSLPGARTEVQEVSSVESTSAQPMVFTGAAATEASFRAEAPGATEIHLATHGYMSDSQPLLSGVILAASEGDEPSYERDGFLTVAEVFRLRLNTRLVTLSACDTGLGATGADGVFGLQSAFLSAGAASLVSTLWKVDDAAAAALMREFYTRLRNDPQHNRALALQAAQLSLLNSAPFKNPLYWAPFVLTGEAR